MSAEDQTIEEYVAENEEKLRRVIRHSDDTYARACAWAILDIGGEGPEAEQLRNEASVDGKYTAESSDDRIREGFAAMTESEKYGILIVSGSR